MARSVLVYRRARFGSILLKALVLMRLSTTCLLTVRRSTRSQKSKSDLNGLLATIDVIAVSPTFLIAARPKRMPFGVGVKFTSLELMSGGRIAMPMSRHSLMYFTTLSVLLRSLVSRAAMKYRGCFALRYAVR